MSHIINLSFRICQIKKPTAKKYIKYRWKLANTSNCQKWNSCICRINDKNSWYLDIKLTMSEIDYKKKLNIMKKVSDIHLTEKDLEVFYYLNEQTGKDWGQVEIRYWDWLDNQQFWISDAEMSRLLYNLSILDIIDSNRYIGGGYYNISVKGIQLLRAIEAEENKSRRDRKILPRANKQSPLRPFISILIAVWALVVAIAW